VICHRRGGRACYRFHDRYLIGGGLVQQGKGKDHKEGNEKFVHFGLFCVKRDDEMCNQT